MMRAKKRYLQSRKRHPSLGESLQERYTSEKIMLTKRGYNKFLTMREDVKVEIDYDKIKEDERWDGLKGYLTNTTIAPVIRFT